jgi:hypothetical protein
MKPSFKVRRAEGVGLDPRLLFITGPCFCGLKPPKQAKILFQISQEIFKKFSRNFQKIVKRGEKEHVSSTWKHQVEPCR